MITDIAERLESKLFGLVLVGTFVSSSASVRAVSLYRGLRSKL